VTPHPNAANGAQRCDAPSECVLERKNPYLEQRLAIPDHHWQSLFMEQRVPVQILQICDLLTLSDPRLGALKKLNTIELYCWQGRGYSNLGLESLHLHLH
jgi:hypothetical protein